ncbi:FtsX-like permease family protein [Rugosimonospora africana]|uniref:ABC3 transporter permease C-terminal domain-containing protein n=1 Tax=Rugosimonospora africana TaxID=556532 RepID=A0A8J3QM54_9ACTN|nr:FtsX-like permease family protein [Rugosimonospora africana]GIH13503.1 hypothetical protein Raf01_16750 [Rugosimonospora africana]
MLAVALGAIRARSTQAAALLVIAVLVTAAAVAAPFFVLAATGTVAARDVSVAPVAQRLVTARQDLSLDGGAAAIQQTRDQIGKDLSLPRFDQVGGVTVTGSVLGPAGGAASSLAIRDGVCGQVKVQGGCPSATGDAMLSSRTASALGVRVGDPVTFRAPAISRLVQLRVSGVYLPRDAGSLYWGAGGLLAEAPAAAQDSTLPSGPPDAVFVSEDTLVATRSQQATVTVDAISTPAALTVDRLPGLAQAVNDQLGRLKSDEYQVDTSLPDLISRIQADQRVIVLGVPLGAGELVLFGWFALFLAVTTGATARRADLGLLKLRGLPSRRVWGLAVQQSALPVLLGVPPGALLGWLLARILAGGIGEAGQLRLAVLLAVAAAAVAVLGGLLAALVAERRTVRADVVELLRRTPSRRRAGRLRRILRPELIDFALAALALAGVYQVHASAAGEDAGLVVIAPGLVAFAAGLLVARLLVPVASRSASRALRAGRLRGTLTATYLARRPGLERLFALLTIAVAVLGYAALAWDTSAAAQHDRAAQELGADRVLTLGPVPGSRLLAAVRSADPSGRYAMAAVQAHTRSGVPAVLAVDTSRLAAVATWNPHYGPAPAALVPMLHPPAPAPVRMVAGGLALDVTVRATSGGPVYLVANLTAPDGRRILLRYGPVSLGAHRYDAASPACVRAPGCRLDGFGVTSGFNPAGQPLTRPGPGLDLTLTALTGTAGGDGDGDGAGTAGDGTSGGDGGGTAGDGGSADLAGFRQPSRWRPTTDPAAAGPVLSSGPDGLRVALPPGDAINQSTKPDGQVYLVDAPTPVPVLLAGQLREAGLAGNPGVDLFGSEVVPIRVAAQVSALPRLGSAGALVDLDYADRLVDDGGGAVTAQVWLAAGAPSSIVDKLGAAGLYVVSDDTIGRRQDGYSDSGPGAALRFQLLGAVLAVVLAAAGLVQLAAVERGPRSEELTALRGQGLPVPAARAVAFGGYGWLAGAALLTGLLVAPVDRLVTGATVPLFVDSWAVLPPPALLRPGGLLIAAAATIAVLGATAAVVGRALMRRVYR